MRPRPKIKKRVPPKKTKYDMAWLSHFKHLKADLEAKRKKKKKNPATQL